MRCFFTRTIATCVNSIRKKMKTGMSYEDAWQQTAVSLVAAAEVLTKITRVFLVVYST